MIKPTIGRVVWYWDATSDQAQVALISYVHTDTEVNLAIFDRFGKSYAMQNVKLWQGSDERPKLHFCEWMPYQKGQASKTEALEAQLK